MKKIILSLILAVMIFSPLSAMAFKNYDQPIIDQIQKDIKDLKSQQPTIINQESSFDYSIIERLEARIVKLEAEVKETRSLMDIILQLLTALQQLISQLLTNLI